MLNKTVLWPILGLCWVLLAAPVFPLAPLKAQGDAPGHAVGMGSPVPVLEPASRFGMVNVGGAPLHASSQSLRYYFVEGSRGRISKPASATKSRTLLILLQRLQLEGG